MDVATVGGPDGHGQVAATIGYASLKVEHLSRLNKIEGHSRGISATVIDDRYCNHVMTPVSAATHALHAVAADLLDDHIGFCVLNAINADPCRRRRQHRRARPDVRAALRL